MVAIARDSSCASRPKALRAVTDCASRTLMSSNSFGVEDRALYRHQPFAEILIDTRFHLNCHRSGILSHSSIFHCATVREASARLNYTQVSRGSEADDNIERCSGPHPALRKSSTPRMSHPTAP